jgi:hypothetical protein
MAVSHDSLSDIHSLTARIPASLYEDLRKIASKRRVSLNSLVQEALSTLARTDREERFRQGFAKLAELSPESDVKFAEAAQAEVALGD